MPQPHVFSGKLNESAKGLVLHADDGHDFLLRRAEGIDAMIGDHVIILGLLNEDETINVFRVQRNTVDYAEVTPPSID